MKITLLISITNSMLLIFITRYSFNLMAGTSMNSYLKKNEMFTLFYNRHSKALISFIINLGTDEDTAEEIMQESFLRIYRKCREMDPDNPKVRSYLYTTARHLVIDLFRRMRTKDERYRHYYIEEVELNPAFFECLEDAYLTGEIISTVNDTIDSFSGIERDVLIEKYIFEKNNREISRTILVPVHRIRIIEKNLRLRLRQRLYPIIGEWERDRRR